MPVICMTLCVDIGAKFACECMTRPKRGFKCLTFNVYRRNLDSEVCDSIAELLVFAHLRPILTPDPFWHCKLETPLRKRYP